MTMRACGCVLSLCCIIAASIGDASFKHVVETKRHTDKESQRVMLDIGAKGDIGTKGVVEHVHKDEQGANDTDKHDGKVFLKSNVTKMSNIVKGNDVKAHVQASEKNTGKGAESLVRASDQPASLRSRITSSLSTWAQEFTQWKSNVVESTEEKTNSLWERTKSNSSDLVPPELYPAEYVRTYCYESISDCWSKKLKDLPKCTNSHTEGDKCKCSDKGDDLCNSNSLTQTIISAGRCVDLRVYVSSSGKEEEVQCIKMVKNKQWKESGLVAQSSDGPESKALPWYKWCGFGYTFKDGQCKRKVRFLTETCWGADSHGACAGSDLSHDEFSTGCFKGKCMPFSYISQERVECSCSLPGWHLPFACSAENDRCGGHPCVWNEASGKKFCNYAEKQNWNDASHFVTTPMRIAFWVFLVFIIGFGVLAYILIPSEVKAHMFHEIRPAKLSYRLQRRLSAVKEVA